MRLWMVVPLVLCVSCGSSGSGSTTGTGSGTTGGSSGGNSVSCTGTSGGQKTCGVETWTGSFSTSDFEAACQTKSGTIGTSCDLTGAVGGCKMTETVGSIIVVTTSWFYEGTSQDIQTACAAGGGTFVSP
jgi:hypothetical protein